MTRELARFGPTFNGYTELRVQHNTDRRVALVNGDVLQNTSATTGGVSARVWREGVWGFASAPRADDGAIGGVVARATENARYLGGRIRKDLGPLPVTHGVCDEVFHTTRNRWSNAEAIDFVKAVDDDIARRHPAVTSRTLFLSTLDMDKHLYTSEQADARSMIPRTILVVVLSAEVGGEPFEVMEIHGGFGQLEDTFGDPAALQPALAAQAEHLHRKCEAVYAKAGRKPCILDAQLAGILAHEAIGHTTEADLVLGGSVAGSRVGKQVASPLVSLTDFASHALGERCPVPLYVDDEGTPGRDVPIIEQGVLRGFMHNKETALRFGVQPTGNARAYAFSDEPLVRMRNTSFLPGTSKLEDMIASIDDGYYLVRSSNGQADATSEFMFGVVLGYEIKGGKLGRAIRDTTISGIAFDVLQTVSMVSDEIVWQCGGMCGKKQMIPVGMGGPAIKCTVHIGGQ